ncbi:LysR substrate-binding domain-containing protein [Jiella marina]|uniref:LysR substrate-binding domain-containing protein n=1 Tax=Jiella sp. LLJ827 TaxID=2917712 RepID=UPI002100E539|nr:LysR substrate-binding domain-containing protein [Jiella sp. LLJ827]MCQ0988673.1 LysR substrate-binding domain-containing protein [Jiella sp. LLJ827]
MSSLTFDIRILRSLLSIAETGSVTETARRLGRTQPAITLQLKRLEDLSGRSLFRQEGRRMVLTTDGQMILTYAKSILRSHDELITKLASDEIEGQVVLGTPDLYAPYVLPDVLSHFRKEFPKVQVQLQCSLSTPLVRLVHRGEIDVALVTRMNDFTGGQVVQRQQLIWVTGERSSAHEEVPVPLALLPPGNIFRDHAIAALEQADRPWRIACISESISGLQAAVFSGMAVAVLGRKALVPGMRELEPSPQFPLLPKVEMLLYKSPVALSPAAHALHQYLKYYLDPTSSGPAALTAALPPKAKTRGELVS